MAPPVGFKHSPETLERMRISHAAKPHPMLGKKHTQEALAKMSAIHKGQSSPMKGKQHSPESIEKMRASHGKGECNPLFGIKRPESVKLNIRKSKLGHPVSQDTRNRISIKIHERLPEYRDKLVAAWNDPDLRKKRLEIMNTEEYKEKVKHCGKDHPQWKGGISFEPYCPKFNKEFKERVRTFFDHKCVECGNPENGKHHSVHHVNFNKMSCCDTSIPLFVTLCHNCHTKTNYHREYWEQHFTDMINIYYGGKCYFTIEEMERLKC